MNKKVELFFTLFERMKNECFKDDNTVSLKILLLSIYTSIIVLHTIRTAPSLHLYYGDYNMILDTIHEEEKDIYWMDENFRWDGYVKEKIIVIPMITNDISDLRNIVYSSLQIVNNTFVEKIIVVTDTLQSYTSEALAHLKLESLREFSVVHK